MCKHVSILLYYVCINLDVYISLVNAGAIFGNPKGNSRTRVVLTTVTRSRVLEVERTCNTAEKLARGLLQLLFSPDELSKGNCTKPIRDVIGELDGERLWAKCYNPLFHLHLSPLVYRSSFWCIILYMYMSGPTMTGFFNVHKKVV